MAEPEPPLSRVGPGAIYFESQEIKKLVQGNQNHAQQAGLSTACDCPANISPANQRGCRPVS